MPKSSYIVLILKPHSPFTTKHQLILVEKSYALISGLEIALSM